MKFLSSSRAVLVTLVLSLICFNPCLVFGVVTISLTTPTAGTTWQAGANLNVDGLITWQMDVPQGTSDAKPNGWSAYVRAGGKTGTVTNSTRGMVTNPTTPPVDPGTNDEDFAGSLTLTPASPPIGGGGGANATYFIQATATFKSLPRATTLNSIQVRNG